MRPHELSLKGLTARASSARVLDLHALAGRKLEDPAYVEQPLFVHPALNRSILVKHNVRSGEEDRLAPRRFNATKVIFPFDRLDLNLGGDFLFIDQRDFLGALTRRLDYTGLSLDRDVAVLRTIDKLPTLDPFLVHESLSLQQIVVGECYFRLSKTDEAEMLGFVSNEITSLIRLCFGELKANDTKAQRLSQLLLSDQNSPELAPLRDAFRMDVSEFSVAMFSWKAFLYYRWRSATVGPMLKATLNSISDIQARRFHVEEVAFVNRAKRLLEKTITTSWRDAKRQLGLYDEAFASLTGEGKLDGFQAFLTRGQSLFFELGDRIGRLEQVASFWNDRFATARMAGLSPDEVLDGMRDLLQALAIDMHKDGNLNILPKEPGDSDAAAAEASKDEPGRPRGSTASG